MNIQSGGAFRLEKLGLWEQRNDPSWVCLSSENEITTMFDFFSSSSFSYYYYYFNLGLLWQCLLNIFFISIISIYIYQGGLVPWWHHFTWILKIEVECFFFLEKRSNDSLLPQQANVSIAKEAETTVEAVGTFSCSILGLIRWQATCEVSFCYILCSVLKYTIYGICRSEIKESNMLSLCESLRWWYCLCSSYAIGRQPFFISGIFIGQPWDQDCAWQQKDSRMGGNKPAFVSSSEILPVELAGCGIAVATCGIFALRIFVYTF